MSGSLATEPANAEYQAQENTLQLQAIRQSEGEAAFSILQASSKIAVLTSFDALSTSAGSALSVILAGLALARCSSQLHTAYYQRSCEEQELAVVISLMRLGKELLLKRCIDYLYHVDTIATTLTQSRLNAFLNSPPHLVL